MLLAASGCEDMGGTAGRRELGWTTAGFPAWLLLFWRGSVGTFDTLASTLYVVCVRVLYVCGQGEDKLVVGRSTKRLRNDGQERRGFVD